MEGNTKIDLSTLKPVKGGAGFGEVDFMQFHNKQVKIVDYDIMQVKSKYTPLGPDGKNLLQWVVKFISEPLAVLEKGTENEFPLTASEMFNLTQDKTGKLLGVPTNKDSKLVLFMKDLGANEIKDVIGKTATVKVYDTEYEGQTRKFMKFKY